MAYKVATSEVTTSEVIKDDKTAVFYDVIVGVNHTTAGPFTGIGGSASFGYVSGGDETAVTNGGVNVIQKFPFSSDTNASDVGDLISARAGASGGASSSNHGYASGGMVMPGFAVINEISRFPFASDDNAADVGDLTRFLWTKANQQTSSHGYANGGYSPDGGGYNDGNEKFAFAASANATDVGDLTQARNGAAGQSSETHGYTSGGTSPTVPDGNVIDKFTFASDGNSTDVGDLTQGGRDAAGQSSSTHGYTSSRSTSPLLTIDKFPFASDVNAADVGDLLNNSQSWGAGQSSSTHGYYSGGQHPTPDVGAAIQKFPFSSDANSADVGDLLTIIIGGEGHQG